MNPEITFHDFIEIEYTGRLANGVVFDTTNKEIAQKNNLYSPQMKYQPLIICVGEKQIIEGLDKNLLGKKIGETYFISLKPEQAFGKKDFKKIRLIPLIEFQKRNIEPRPGLQINLDGEIGVVIKAAGGRILVNFNHPLAGKEVIYEVKINKKIQDKKIQLKSFLELSLNFPNPEIELQEDKAEVILPFELPPEIQEKLSKKLKEIVHLKEITFKKKNSKTTSKQ